MRHLIFIAMLAAPAAARPTVTIEGVPLSAPEVETSAVETGAYGALRLYVPVANALALVLEGGGYYLGDRHYTSMCWGPLEYQSSAAWAGAGLQWSL